jgi:hypothetical protein
VCAAPLPQPPRERDHGTRASTGSTGIFFCHGSSVEWRYHLNPGFAALSPNGACVARYNRPNAPQLHPMAHIIPEGWQVLEAAAAAQREIETLALLAATLSDAYTVHQGMHCTRANQSHALVGEIDFAIINPAGDLLLIEQESGCIQPLPQSPADRLWAVKSDRAHSHASESGDRRCVRSCP